LIPPASPGGAWTEATLGGSPYLANPHGALAIGKGGVLYGTATFGGSGGGVFALTPPASSGGAWTYAVLYNFAGLSGDGAYPYAGVAIGKDGVLYGTTGSGGSSGKGTVFSLTPPRSPGRA